MKIDIEGNKVDIKLVKHTKDYDGELRGNTIRISIEADREFTELLAHEIAHFIVREYYTDVLSNPVTFDTIDEAMATISEKVIRTFNKNEKKINRIIDKFNKGRINGNK